VLIPGLCKCKTTCRDKDSLSTRCRCLVIRFLGFPNRALLGKNRRFANRMWDLARRKFENRQREKGRLEFRREFRFREKRFQVNRRLRVVAGLKFRHAPCVKLRKIGVLPGGKGRILLSRERAAKQGEKEDCQPKRKDNATGARRHAKDINNQRSD